jgi:hypothetical protein
MAATSPVAKNFAGLYPAKGTAPMAANELIYDGCTVCINATGYAVEGALNEGFNAAGVVAATFDNRTTAPEGGGAGAINCEIEYGIFGRTVNGTAPVAGNVVFVYDNMSVTLDSNSGARGIAGMVTEVRTINGVVIAFVFMGPAVTGLIATAAADEADIDQLQTDVDAAEVAIDALEANAVTAQAQVQIPITSWRLATGAAIPAFSNGVADGFELTDSEALGLRINDDSTTSFATSVAMPQDLDDAAAVVVHLLGFRVGAADTSACVTIGAFFQTVAAAHTADTNCGGDSTTFAAATTVVSEKIVTLALADVPAAPCNLTLTMVVKNTTLADDDLVILSTWLEYTRKVLAA